MGEWTEVKSEKALDRALALAQGDYQRNLIMGYENVSGSSLRGSAKNWGGKYAASRKALFHRLEAAGVPYSIEKRDRRLVLVLG